MILTYLLGILGLGTLLAAFILQMFNILGEHRKGIYVLLNVLGAAVACYTSMRSDFLPFVILFGLWCLAAVIGLFRSGRRGV